MYFAYTHSRSQSQPRGGKRRGAAAVEFALVSMVFFGTILGIVEISRAIMVTHLLTDAARQGCRVGIIEGKSSSNITSVTISALTAQGINGETATVQVNDNTVDASTANAADEITVLVSVPVSNVLWLPFTKWVTSSLYGKYTMRRE